MPEIKKLLFPLDFSHQSMRAGRYMESMAGRFQAEIMLLHIVDPAAFPIITQHLEPSCKERLDAFLADDLKQFAVRRVCLTGDPAEEISKMVRFWTPDLVMMPSYGLGFYRPSLLGSVTAKVLQDVNCPVWTSVHAEDAPPLESI
ncbi:MAG TPA: universal stress protein, partial [Bryobacteraceae bacterium]|nr:universal stress protein [Bryobacteraceae bacterium]